MRQTQTAKLCSLELSDKQPHKDLLLRLLTVSVTDLHNILAKASAIYLQFCTDETVATRLLSTVSLLLYPLLRPDVISAVS